MNEFELTVHAKQVIDNLAQGIDPNEKVKLPKDTVLNDPRLIRSFFHVSKKLGEIIANGGEVGRAARKDLPPFKLTEEQKANIRISETPLSITNFVDEINRSADLSVMRKCNYSAITAWLLKNGYLNEVVVNDKKKKVINAKSATIGITDEDRISSTGIEYKVIMYTPQAQRFILDNMEEMFGQRA